jgi:plastocyanin
MLHRVPSLLSHRISRALCLPLLMWLAACGGSEPAADPAAGTPAAQPFTNATVGVSFLDVPEGFALDGSDDDSAGDSVRFVRTDGKAGTVTVYASPQQTAGVNLVQATRDHKAEMLALTDGRYNGSLELLGPLGTAFQSRGGYRNDEGEMMEDFRIYSLHPLADRMLVVRYLYPAGTDMAERQQELFAVLGEIEPPVDAQEPGPAPEPTSEPESPSP